MTAHYAMWGIMAILIVSMGAIYKGQQDFILESKLADARLIAVIDTLSHISIKDLPKIKI